MTFQAQTHPDDKPLTTPLPPLRQIVQQVRDAI